MFHRSLTLVDDNVAVELGRDNSHLLYLTASYRKTGTHKIQSVPFYVRNLFSCVFGTSTAVKTSHTLLSANRSASRAPIGGQRVWMDCLAQTIQKYLCNCLGLKPYKKARKHRIYLCLVLIPMEPSSDPIIMYPVCTITGNTLSGICSRRFSELSRDNFDKFLMSTGLYHNTWNLLASSRGSEVNQGTLGASTPEDCVKADQQTCKSKKGGH